MDKISEQANVVVQAIGEGQTVLNKAWGPLPQGVVEAFNVVRFAVLRAKDTMALRQQHRHKQP